jgi:hypothetical protein
MASSCFCRKSWHSFHYIRSGKGYYFDIDGFLSNIDIENLFLFLFNSASSAARIFHCVGGCWEQTQDCGDYGFGSRTLKTLG